MTFIGFFGACNSGDRAIHSPDPRESETPAGYSAAEYGLEAKTRAALATVKVWSLGTELLETSGRSASLVLVGFSLTNTGGGGVISFAGERLLLDAGTATGFSVNNVRAIDAPSSVDVGPEETREIRVRFELPGKPAPRDIQAFRVHWVVASGDDVFDVTTPFIRPESRRLSTDDNGFYYSPHYDPFYEGAFVYRALTAIERPYKHERFRTEQAAPP